MSHLKNACISVASIMAMIITAMTLSATSVIAVGGVSTTVPDSLNTTVNVSKNKGTIYDLFKHLSEQSGYLFIYDSQIIDNNRKVKIRKGNYALSDAIRLIAGNNELKIELSGKYILLQLHGDLPQNTVARLETDTAATVKDIVITGRLFDVETKEALVYASVSILRTSIGSITNHDGEFQLLAPDSLRHARVRFSHIGYESQEIEIAAIDGRHVDFAMRPQIIPLQEVVVTAVEPVKLLCEMLENRPLNYASDPVNLTSFYREGINHYGRNIDLTEAILQIYKTGYQKSSSGDQVKLMRKRRIINRLKTDTIFPRMRSGVHSCLILDIIKELPEFIVPNEETQYRYSYSGKSAIDGKTVHIIGFKQKSYIKEPLYEGELYIEDENKALTEVRFVINPAMADKATHSFVSKIAPGFRISLQHAGYVVSYKRSSEGKYYINHIRGDIRFKIRKKRQLFSSPLNFWFETVTCRIDTVDVKPFPQNERLRTTRVFAETSHAYDSDFWKHFNVILPEEMLQEDIINSLNNEIVTEQ